MQTRPLAALAFAHPDFDAAAPGLAATGVGALALAEGPAAIRQAVLMLLSTMPGERVRRPRYGCALHRLAFAPNDDTTHGLAIHYVARALALWEPRVQVIGIDAMADPDRPEVMRVTLDYRIRRSGQTDQVALGVDLGAGG